MVLREVVLSSRVLLGQFIQKKLTEIKHDIKSIKLLFIKVINDNIENELFHCNRNLEIRDRRKRNETVVMANTTILVNQVNKIAMFISIQTEDELK